MNKQKDTRLNNGYVSYLKKIEDYLEDFFTHKAPTMSEGTKETIVKYNPYITILIIVLTLPVVVTVIGFGSIIPSLTLTTLFLLVSVVVEALSVPGLMKRSMTGWKWAYYAVWVNIIYALLSGNIISMLISGALGFWVLFQIKKHYK